MRSLRRRIPIATLLVTITGPLAAQVQQQGGPTGLLTPATTNADAAAAFKTGLEQYQLWRFGEGANQAARALELDPNFGLARTLQAIATGGPTLAAELRRGAVDGASASAPEALMTLGAREINAGRAAAGRRIYATAVDLLPNDANIATWHASALAGEPRVVALREVAKKFPNDVASRLWLGFYLATVNDSIAQMNATEAVSVAQEAVRLAPRMAAPHVMYGHVLIQLRRFDEAKQHLNAAATLEPRIEYGFELLALLASIENRQADMRVALDSAIALSVNQARITSFKRARALSHLSEKKPQLALAELAALAKAQESNRGAAALTHLFMATVSAATNDAAGVEQHLQAARDLGATGTTLHDYEAGTYSLTRQGAKARIALENYIRVSGPQPNLTPAVNAARTVLVHRLTGQVLLAEGKPREAIEELKQGGDNPYVTVFLVEAHRQLKDNRQADATLKAFFERAELSFVSTAVPTIRYRNSK